MILGMTANQGLVKQASTSIDEPGFTHVWNLLDIVSIFSDNGQSRDNEPSSGRLF